MDELQFLLFYYLYHHNLSYSISDEELIQLLEKDESFIKSLNQIHSVHKEVRKKKFNLLNRIKWIDYAFNYLENYTTTLK